MEDEDDDIFDQTEFLNERDVWNRVGGPNLGTGLINLKIGNYTPSEKFKLIAAATINTINDYDVSEIISNAQTIHMLSLVDENIPDFEYKNPSAFVMGYLVASQSDYQRITINQDVLDDIIQINKDIEDQLFSKIEDVDIVRYTRLCLLNKLR